MATELPDHCTYIVRVWKEATTQPDETQWRFALIISSSARRQGFIEIESLLKALQAELTKITGDSAPDPPRHLLGESSNKVGRIRHGRGSSASKEQDCDH
ncbi:hypothetical protein BH10CHL1_BH10CHL1_45950 [soil metagenome]